MAIQKITSGILADGAIVAADIANGSITTAKIADGNVTSAKIDTVANTKITGLVTASQIANVANTQVTGSIEATQVGTTVSQLFGMRNRIINGAMVIDQRNSGASVTASSSGNFSLDRWQLYSSTTGKFTVQQNAASVTPPVDFSYYAGCTSTSSYSITSTDQMLFQQKIEGYNVADLAWGTANAKTVTLSFWVRSSLTGTFGGSIQNNAQDRCFPYSYTISAANTWEYKTITVVGDTTGTWLTNNGLGINVQFSLGTGTTYSGTAGAWTGTSFITSVTGAVSVVGTNAATWYVTGVQLEVGTTATPFERRLYNQELDNCQRYYWQLNGEATYAGIGSGTMNTASVARVFIPYPMPMRASPTISVTNIGNTIVAQGSDLTPSSIASYPNSTGAMVDITTGTGTQGRGAIWMFNALASASVQATAEL